jgi:hypothetical protein
MADDDEDSEGVDISKIGLEDADEPKATDALARRVTSRPTASGALQAAMKSVDAFGAATRAARDLSSVGRVNDHLDAILGAGSFAKTLAQHDVMRGLAASQVGHLPALSRLSALTTQNNSISQAIASVTGISDQWAHIRGLSAATRLAEEIRANQAIYLQPASMLADLYSRPMSGVQEALQALTLPQFRALDALALDRISGTVARADIFKSLGLPAAFDSDFRSVTSLLSDQLSAVTSPQGFAAAAGAAVLPGAIESLLARSLEAQETLLAEHRESEAEARVDARFHRRAAVLMGIINILMFLLAVAMNIEDWVSDDDAALRENTRAVQEMRQSFDEMTEQMQRMQSSQEAGDEAERAADAAIIDLLRDISETLEAQSASDDNQDVDN